MDTENQHTNGDQGNKEPQQPVEESIPSSGDQDNRPQSPAPEDSSPPEEKAKKINAPRILRNLIADRQSLGLPGSPYIERKLVKLEEIIEANLKLLFGEGDKSKDQ